MKCLTILAIILVFPICSSLTIENVTFQSDTHIVYVNGSISLNETIITDESMMFYNISDGGRFDNSNDTGVSNVSFYGLDYSIKNDIRYGNGTIIKDLSDINYSVALPSQIIRFLNCSPDWTYYPTKPNEQTTTIAAINSTNNGTLIEDFQIKYIGSINTGWTLFACNDSSELDPDNDADCFTLTDSFQTIWNNVSADDEKQIWLYGNCSEVSANPGVSIEMVVA